MINKHTYSSALNLQRIGPITVLFLAPDILIQLAEAAGRFWLAHLAEVGEMKHSVLHPDNLCRFQSAASVLKE